MNVVVRFARTARAFLRDQSGSITVEAMLILPLLVWGYLAIWVFFDGYRAQAVNLRTAATMGDILSRQKAPITPEFMDSLFQLQAVLVESVQPRQLRVTHFRYDPVARRYWVVWSRTRGAGVTGLTDAQLNHADMRAALPQILGNERAILTETWVDYVPPARVGLGKLRFRDFIVTRPRYGAFSPYCWSDSNDPPHNESNSIC